MENRELAQKLAKGIMDTGSDPGRPVQRIQFMGGEYPKNEIPQGGLCEAALSEVIYRLLHQIGG